MSSSPPKSRNAAVTVATYNIHTCVGHDGKYDPERVVGVIREIEPDVIGLQEVSARHRLSGVSDQFEYFEQATGLHHGTVGLNIARERFLFGNSLLSRWPITDVRRHDLSLRGHEPRGAIDAIVAANGDRLRVIVTHFGVTPYERRLQTRRLAKALDARPPMPTVLLGDFNIWGPAWRVRRALSVCAPPNGAPRTYPARFPLLALDRIWTRPDPLLDYVRSHRTPLARAASDHLPVVAEITLAEHVGGAPAGSAPAA